MHLKLYLFIYFIFLFLFSKAQVNLVENGSFENYSICPDGQDKLEYAVNWFNPTYNTPDYYNACFNGPYIGSFSDVPHNWIGYQHAYLGQAYTGIALYYYTGGANGREYIQTQLKDELQFNKKYEVSFYLNLANRSFYATDRIGAYLSVDQIQDTLDGDTLSYIPQIENPIGNVISDTANWVKISGSYTAQGGEQWLTIGNFFADADTRQDTVNSINNGAVTGAYYYIDSVSVIEDTGTGIQENKINSFNLFPNPNNGKFVIQNTDESNYTITITNVLGEVIYKNISVVNVMEIDLSKQGKGIYTISIIDERGLFETKKIIIN